MALANCCDPLGRERGARRDAGVLDLADALGDQLGLDGLGVDLLHPSGGLVVVELGDLLEQRLGVLVAGPETLEVEDTDPAEPADLDGGGRADHRVHGRGHQRQLEAEGVDLPGDVDVLGVTGATAGHDGDVVEPVGPPRRLADPDLDLSHPSASDSPEVRPYTRGKSNCTGLARGSPPPSCRSQSRTAPSEIPRPRSWATRPCGVRVSVSPQARPGFAASPSKRSAGRMARYASTTGASWSGTLHA